MPKATPLSNIERAFILDALRTGQRVDGRSPYDARTLQFTFGQRPGVVQAQLGRTRCVATRPRLYVFADSWIVDCGCCCFWR